MSDMTHTPAREPFFNAPILALLLPAVLIALYGLQVSLGADMQDVLFQDFALSPILLRQGHYDLLLTHLFLHGSWTHVVFNAGFLLAFGTPVVRACGKGFTGVLSYLSFYLLCGIVAGFGFCALNYQSNVPVVGASGAIAGLMGAAIRMRGMPGTSARLDSIVHPRVVMMTVVWCGMNAVTAFLPMLSGVAGATIAWQAHITGYIFGMLLIGPWLKAFYPAYFTTN